MRPRGRSADKPSVTQLLAASATRAEPVAHATGVGLALNQAAAEAIVPSSAARL